MERGATVRQTGRMRPITAVVLAILLVMILGAAAIQLVLATR